MNAEMPDRQRLLRDRALRRRFTDQLIPGLPVDGDAPIGRVPTARVGTLMMGLLDKMLVQTNPFYETVCARWEALFPDLPARPGRWQADAPKRASGGIKREPPGKLFLYVASSGQLFALRAKLPKIRAALAALPGAPARFTVHLEIHAPAKRRP